MAADGALSLTSHQRIPRRTTDTARKETIARGITYSIRDVSGFIEIMIFNAAWL